MKLLRDDLPPAALRVLAQAREVETVHGEYRTVWHCWGDGPPLVLMHGGSGSWTHWIRNVQPLAAAGWQVMVPDIPGFGDSAAAADAADVDALVEPIARGLRELAQPGLRMAGFSFGGLLGGLVAAQHPDLVAQLVFIGAPGLGLRDKRLPLAPWLGETDAERVKAAHRKNLRTLMLHRDDSIDDFTVALQHANLLRDRLRRRKMALTDILARTLPSLTCRVDAIYGDDDALYVGKMDEVEAIFRGCANFGEFVRIADAGHWVQYEAADEFNAVLRCLLEP